MNRVYVSNIANKNLKQLGIYNVLLKTSPPNISTQQNVLGLR